MNLKKNLKFIVGGLTVAVFTVIIIFAAAPTHAQADESSEQATTIVATETATSSELCADIKDCSAECMENEECKQLCAPNCAVTCE